MSCHNILSYNINNFLIKILGFFFLVLCNLLIVILIPTIYIMAPTDVYRWLPSTSGVSCYLIINNYLTRLISRAVHINSSLSILIFFIAF